LKKIKSKENELENKLNQEEKYQNKENIVKQDEKYENKYLEDIRKLNKEFKFSQQEELLRLEKAEMYFNKIIQDKKDKIKIIEKEILFCQEKKEKYINLSEEDFLKEKYDNEYIDKYIDKYSEYDYYETKEEIINVELSKLLLLEKDKKELLEILKNIESKEGQIELIKKSNEIALEFIVDKHLERIINCYIIESTPHGNVLMIYDNSKKSFKYYSDNSIPYRYLEPVARKYVKQFNCRPIFIDMEYELKVAEEKWENERKEKEIKEKEEEKRKEPIKDKKNVFAKLKSYNKDAGKINTCAPPKNSIPNNNLTKEQENEKILLKENANRYTYEGKFINFNFLKKVDRKIVDKKYALTFADFKKLNNK
jgi:hypothetical protein